jgi:hypothetical protein
MISSISGISANTSTQATTTSQQAVQTATPQGQSDTVHVSLAAKARLMKQQGMTIAQIASSLGLDIKDADSLFGSTQNVAALPAAQIIRAQAK